MARTTLAVLAPLSFGLLCAAPARGDQILTNYGASLTSFKYAGSTRVQLARPRFDQRGLNLDGSLRAGPLFSWSIAGNPFEAGMGGGKLGDLSLLTGSYNPVLIQAALPAPGAAR